MIHLEQVRSYKFHHKNGVLTQQVLWLDNLILTHSNSIIGKYWNNKDLNILQQTKGLPKNAFMKYRRLNWFVPETVYLPDRIKRIAETQAMVVLIEQARLNNVIQALKENTDIPRYTTSHDIKRLSDSLKKNPDATNFTQIFTKPIIKQARIDASTVDKGFSATTIVENKIVTIVKLPIISEPKVRKDWKRSEISFVILDYISKDFISIHSPVITSDGFTYPFTYNVPDQYPANTKIGMGIDWGVTTLVTMSIGSKNGVSKTHHTLNSKLVGKIERLRVNSETVKFMAQRLEILIKNNSKLKLVDKYHVLATERNRLDDKRKKLNKELAWLVATNVTKIAKLNNVNTIYVENLKTLVARRKRLKTQ